MIAPIMAYPLIENAIRAEAGGRRRSSSSVDRRALVAVQRGRRRARGRLGAERAYDARRAVDRRRPATGCVTLPYTKLLNANIQVDQAAALVLCSAANGRRARDRPGAPRLRPRRRRARPTSGSSRSAARSPPRRRSAPAARRSSPTASSSPGELGPVDLYSCFPAAVQLGAAELGLPLDDPGRPLTCTGGLTFFGGPGNNYATHGIAAVARELRAAEPGTRGLATALGWYATKHALGVYGNEPPARRFAALAPEPAPAAARGRRAARRQRRSPRRRP